MRNRRPGRKSFVKTVRSMLSSERGFSLMEMMITVAVLGIVALGTSVLFSDMFSVQKRGDVGRTIQTMRNDIVGALTKSNTHVVPPAAFTDAWSSMIAPIHAASNPGLDCLRNGTVCNHLGEEVINVRNYADEEIFDSRNPTRGFRGDGRLCNTFSVATPDPTCPFRWEIAVEFHCVGENKSECENPSLHFVGTLVFAPGPNNPFGSTGFNVANYGFNVRRGDKPDLNMPIKLAYVMTNATGEAGGCMGTWHTRMLNEEQEDPGNNVRNFTGTGEFDLVPGGYDCRVQVPAFKNGANRIQLIGGGHTFQSSSALAALNGGSAVLTIQATFVVNAQSTFRVQHTCESKPSSGTGPAANATHNDNFSRGVPAAGAGVGDYSRVTYTTVNCVKTS